MHIRERDAIKERENVQSLNKSNEKEWKPRIKNFYHEVESIMPIGM